MRTAATLSTHGLSLAVVLTGASPDVTATAPTPPIPPQGRRGARPELAAGDELVWKRDESRGRRGKAGGHKTGIAKGTGHSHNHHQQRRGEEHREFHCA